MTIIEDGLEANVARLKEEYPDETWEIESSAYERGLEDGRKAAATHEDAQPTRLTHLVALERDIREQLEEIWGDMLKDPTRIKMDDIRALVHLESDPIQPIRDASEAYFVDVDERTMQDDTLLDREDVPGDPALYQAVIDALEEAEIISGVRREYLARVKRALKDWAQRSSELLKTVEQLSVYSYYNAKAYIDVEQHYRKTHKQ